GFFGGIAHAFRDVSASDASFALGSGLFRVAAFSGARDGLEATVRAVCVALDFRTDIDGADDDRCLEELFEAKRIARISLAYHLAMRFAELREGSTPAWAAVFRMAAHIAADDGGAKGTFNVFAVGTLAALA